MFFDSSHTILQYLYTQSNLKALKVVCSQAARARRREYLAHEYLSQTYEYLLYDMFCCFILL